MSFANLQRLTPREIEVLLFTAHGKTRAEIAVLLGISQETVKSHVRYACKKLNARNKTHAIALLIGEGMPCVAPFLLRDTCNREAHKPEACAHTIKPPKTGRPRSVK
jgi:DNA-binding CsgD family transcriptional regulator